MAKRFLNDTEKKLLSLLKSVMQHYKPRTGFVRALLNVLRTIGPGKPRETAHHLSVLVTQDFLIEVIGSFGSQAIAPSFLNIMALVDEEALNHYARPGRAPMFADMLRYAREQIRRGNLLQHRWDVETFASFVDSYLRRRHERVSAEHLRQAMQMLYAPASYRVLSTNWLLLRLLAAGYVRNAVEVIDSNELGPTSPVSSRERTAVDSLLGNYDEEALSEMLETEKGVMTSLFGIVILSTYVNELRAEVAQEFTEHNRFLSRVLSTCSALLGPLGTTAVVAYCASMFSSIIQQAINPSSCNLIHGTNINGINITGNVTGININGTNINGTNINGTNINGTNINGANITIINITGIITEILGGPDCVKRNDSLSAILSNWTGESFAATNESAWPASIAVLTTMYLALPIIAFGGYAAQWVGRRMASRGRGGFTPPAMFSMLSGAVCAKLGLNTFLTLTAHVSHRAFNTALNWSVTRLYLPLSLIEQPKKIGLFVNSAMSAAWSSRRLRFEPSSRACAIAAALSIPFEYAGHVVAKLHIISPSAHWNTIPPACRNILSFTVKHARVAAFFGTLIAARRHLRDMPYSRRLERIIFADGVKAVTAPAALLALDLAAGNVFLSTVVLTVDSIISLVPDMICSANVDMLNNAGSQLAALEQWLAENLGEEGLLKMAVLTSLQRLPGSTHGELEKILEEFYNKDQIIDHGVDLIIDDDFTEGVTERQLLEWQSDDASRRRTRGGDCADASSEGELIGATSRDYYDPPERRRGPTLYEELVRGILERHGTRGADAASEGESVDDELLSRQHRSLSQQLDDAAVPHEERSERGRSSRRGRFCGDEGFDVERQGQGDGRRSRRSDRSGYSEEPAFGDRGHSSRGAASESDARRSRGSDREESATSSRRHPAGEVPQQRDEASPSGPRNHPSGAIPKVRSASAATPKKDKSKKSAGPHESARRRADLEFLGSSEDIERYISARAQARARSPRRGVGTPPRHLDRVVYETEGPQDFDDGVFDITRYVTPRNQAGDSGLRSGPSSSSRAPQGAPGLVPGTSLTSLDDDALDILGAIQEQR
ncbi:Cpg1 family polymorphic protein, partial [Anaplasma phagocytophilum]|uniref:Cpg1 family polymorphic protein n=1 Tax=Anaplasma phagocytophilum TaxID=948 RepID=UPI000A678D19